MSWQIRNSFHFVSKDQAGEAITARIVLTRQHVAVDIQREGRVGVSHEPGNTDNVLAVTDHQARERVPKIVEANSSDSGALKRRLKATRHQVRVAHGLPVQIREDEIVRTVGAGQPPYFQLLQKESREREALIRGARLRFVEMTFPERPANAELAALPVDVAPGCPQDLTRATPAEHANEISNR